MTQKILVVDDSGTVRSEVRAALQEGGFEVIEAGDGVEGVEQLDAHGSFSAIVCDVNMPRMDGIQFLQKLAERGDTIPTVMLTTEGQPELIQRAKQAGAKGWIVKPFKPDLLLKAMKRLVCA